MTATASQALSVGISIRACQAGHRVAFATAAEWVARLAEAHHAGKLQTELIKLGRIPLIVVDELATSPLKPRRPTCFSSWCPPATNVPA